MQIIDLFEKKLRCDSEGGTLDFEQPSNENHGFSGFRAYKKHEKTSRKANRKSSRNFDEVWTQKLSLGG